MSGFNHREHDEPPPGYERVHLDAKSSLMMPLHAVEQFRHAIRCREEAAQSSRRDALHQQQMQKISEAKAERAAQSAAAGTRRPYSVRPKKGWYRVLPRLSDMAKELDGGKNPAGHSEKEFSERLLSTRKALLERGPDRRLGLPKQWRSALEHLESTLPHFGEPIAQVRSSLALAEATGKAVRVPPLLLLGPPGVGKTHFAHELAGLLGVGQGVVSFDQPTYGGQLRGTDSAWANSQTGLLFNLVCLGDHANPVVVLDELDKGRASGSRQDLDPVAQLHGALEPESSRRIIDISVHVEFDASMVTYVATANSVRGLEASVLSRFEVFVIKAPAPADCVALARAVVTKTLARLGLSRQVACDRMAIYLLAHMSPREMTRAVEKSLALVVLDGRAKLLEEDVWAALRRGHRGPGLH